MSQSQSIIVDVARDFVVPIIIIVICSFFWLLFSSSQAPVGTLISLHESSIGTTQEPLVRNAIKQGSITNQEVSKIESQILIEKEESKLAEYKAKISSGTLSDDAKETMRQELTMMLSKLEQ